jgi:hypothetical protein
MGFLNDSKDKRTPSSAYGRLKKGWHFTRLMCFHGSFKVLIQSIRIIDPASCGGVLGFWMLSM